MIYTREILHDRHRMSHQQIDRWLGENRSKEFLQEKLERLEVVKHFLSVTDLLKQNEISFISFKGPLLSYRIYGDPAVRLSHDIDILIEIADIESVKGILIENGYLLMEGSFWPQKKVQQDLLINVNCHLSFYNKVSDFCVEIHWILMHELPLSLNKQKEIIADNLTEMDFAGRKFTVFTKEFELLFLIMHGARHGWNRLKWLVDINNYPVKEINHTSFDQLVMLFHASRIIGQTNSLLKKFFNTTLPFKGDNRLPDYFIRYPLQSINREIKAEQSTFDIIHLYQYFWLMFPDFYYKRRMITGIFFRIGDIPAINSSFKIIYFFYRPYSFIKRRILHV